MKILVSILSFIVLTLSTLPCYKYHSEDNCKVEKQCDNHTKKCNDDCKDNCSPFYSCGNCIGFISIFSTPLPFSKTIVNYTTSVEPITYNNPIHSTFFCKIWQPPKIA
jgi:hypothetical protein